MAAPSRSSSSKPGVQLNVIIIGAGIAGLNAAVGLRNAGHRVVIFEQSGFTNEVGAAITIGPSASRILTEWGFDYEQAGWIPHEKMETHSGTTLATLKSLDFSQAVQRYGDRFASLHRVDLHNELKRLALAEDGPGPVVDIRLRSCVVDVNPTSGTVILGDGTSHTADMLIGSDGLRSVVHKAVVGKESVARDTGMSAFRFLIPTEKVMADPITAKLLNSKRNILSLYLDDSGGPPARLLVWYECRGFVNVLIRVFLPRTSRSLTRDVVETSKILWGYSLRRMWMTDQRADHHHTVSVDVMLKEFERYDSRLVRVLEMADDLKLWRLYDREPLPTWVKDKAVLIGDAAHPMLPMAGQGGTQAIEDGGALGRLLTDLPSRDDIPERLRLFEKVRKNRASVVQILSTVWAGQESRVTDRVQKYREGQPPITNPMQAAEHNLGFDTFAKCDEVLKASQEAVVA